MKLYTKCLDEYFKMLDFKTMEFRQIESIVLENPAGEKREFLVKDIKKLDPRGKEVVMGKYPRVSWKKDDPVFAIELGDEMDRNDLIVKHGEPIEYEKRWCAVGD